jgi:hypothetical protein
MKEMYPFCEQQAPEKNGKRVAGRVSSNRVNECISNSMWKLQSDAISIGIECKADLPKGYLFWGRPRVRFG